MKEIVQVLENEFSRTRNIEKIFNWQIKSNESILDNSLFSQKKTFKNEVTWMFVHSQSNVVFWTFALLVVYDILTKCGERVISYWTVLEVKTHKRKSLEQKNHRLTLTFQWKLNKKRCICERMRDMDVKFIHIISIVIVVYNNGINLKILMSHWRHLTTTSKLPHV